MTRVVRALGAAELRWRPGLITVATQLRPVLLAVVFVGVGMAFAVTSDFDPRHRLVAVTIQACLAVTVGALALLWHRGGRWLAWAADTTAAAASAFPAVMFTVSLHGSTYAIGGLGVAQANRTPAVARYIDTWHLVDYSYEGLPAFYPPLMPWIVGRTASVLDLTAPFALKLAGTAMVFMASLLAYLLWQRLLSRPVAALVPVAIIALVSVTPLLLLQPDSLLSLSLIIPWWLDAIIGVRREGVRRWSPWSYGVIGALIFSLYYYFFLPLALSLLLLPLFDRRHEPQEARPFVRRLRVAATAAGLSAVYWLPLVVSLVRAQQPVSLQNLWFEGSHTTLRVDVFEATAVGLLLFIGLVHVTYTAGRDRLSAALLLMLGGGYAWYVVAFALAAARAPVLAFRTEAFVELILLIAALRALAAVFTLLGRATQPTQSAVERSRDARRVATVIGAALVFVLGQSYVTQVLTYEYVQQSHDTPLADGRLQPYADAGATTPAVSVNEMERAVRDLRGPADDQPVVLSTTVDVLKVTGFYSFNQWQAIYAHPAGEFYARLRFLELLAAQSDASRFAAMARGNRFDPIDVFILRGRAETLEYRATDVDFPYGSAPIRISYKRSQFPRDQWRRRQIGPYFIAVAR